MDAFQLLASDHRKARLYFEKLARCGREARRERVNLFVELRQALEVHTRMAEEVLYPALEHAQQTAGLVAQSRRDLARMRDLLERIEAQELDHGEWDDLLRELQAQVEHHAREEEQELFDRAAAVLSQRDREDLGLRLQEHRQRLLSGS